MNRLKVLIADDHALLRAGLIAALEPLEDEPLVCFEAEDADQVMGVVHAQPDLDLVLLDLFMPGANGFELLRTVCAETAGIPVVVLSGSDDAAQMREALDCGAAGFIPKSAAREVMLPALRLVLAGGLYLPPELLQAPARSEAAGVPNGHLAASPESVRALTARQQDVLRLLGQGCSNKRIARDLGLSENTVKIHVAGILRALGAANRTEAVMRAREDGFDFTCP